jgi:hypothetical protein
LLQQTYIEFNSAFEVLLRDLQGENIRHYDSYDSSYFWATHNDGPELTLEQIEKLKYPS